MLPLDFIRRFIERHITPETPDSVVLGVIGHVHNDGQVCSFPLEFNETDLETTALLLGAGTGKVLAQIAPGAREALALRVSEIIADNIDAKSPEVDL